MVRLSRCCTPVPGDEIMGFVTRGRGVPVHRTDCANAVALVREQTDRVIEVEWDDDSRAPSWSRSRSRRSTVERLLRDVVRALSDHHVNILDSETRTGGDRMCRMRFDFELVDPPTSSRWSARLKRVDSVYDAYRVLPGSAK